VKPLVTTVEKPADRLGRYEVDDLSLPVDLATEQSETVSRYLLIEFEPLKDACEGLLNRVSVGSTLDIGSCAQFLSQFLG